MVCNLSARFYDLGAWPALLHRRGMKIIMNLPSNLPTRNPALALRTTVFSLELHFTLFFFFSSGLVN